MKTLIFTAIFSFLSSTSFAEDENCYQISSSAGLWSKMPELLCIEEVNVETKEYQITLKTGSLFDPQPVAVFNYNLLLRAKCPECNEDVYGIAIPSNSSFNTLQIAFDGEIDLANGTESGTVKIGETLFYYRK